MAIWWNKMKITKLFIEYLKGFRLPVLWYILTALIFFLIFSLYHLPLEPVIYAVQLSIFVGIIIFSLGFSKFYQKQQTLLRLQNAIQYTIDQLPAPQDLLEKQYQELINILNETNRELSDQAETKHRDLVDYFTQWTHQIKTPIAGMRLLLQTEEFEQKEELAMELQRIEQYVEFVLQYLRLENIHSDFTFKDYSLDDIIKQAIRKNAKIFIRKKIALNYEDLNCTVLTDEKWLLFVIEQILSNALKYTNEGSISIYMEPTKEKVLVIEDTGIGITEEDLPRVFEKGFTGFNGRIMKHSTGIGLYLCKRIIEKLSHHISIESKVGVGTKVKIDFSMKKLGVE